MPIEVEIADRQATLPIDEPQWRALAAEVLAEEGIRDAQISLAVVDAPTMSRLHRQYLGIDGPTDVLSFVLEEGPDRCEGEVIVCADVARQAAPRYGWRAEDELLLYVVHGLLHLAGYDDTTDAARRQMRQREAHHLARRGLARPDEPAETSATGGGAGPSSRKPFESG